MLLINLYNQFGAGPKNISLNLIQGLEKMQLDHHIFIIVADIAEYAELSTTNPHLHLIKYKRNNTILGKIWFRICLDLIIIPKIARQHKLKSILAFGNILFTPGRYKKIVLCHHPYLYDDKLLANASIGIKIVEHLKRIAFALTLINVDTVVVQSQFVARVLKGSWRLARNKNIHIIPNPLSETFQSVSKVEVLQLAQERFLESGRLLKLIFVSRYYPHKNHAFLVKLSQELTKKSIPHEIQVTVNVEIKESEDFINQVRYLQLPILNLGELEQKYIAQAYRSAHLFIFPSLSETFGNPIIEAMHYGLPLILPNLGYAEDVAADAGNYYPSNDATVCVQTIQNLTKDQGYYKQRSIDAYEAFSRYPNVNQWIQKYLIVSADE